MRILAITAGAGGMYCGSCVRDNALAAEMMGMPWDHRGRRSEEHIALLRTLWCADGDLVEFHGEYHDIPLIDPEPRPVQRPIPILVGGHSDVALERAARIGDGWIAASMSPEPLAEHWAKVRDAAGVRLITPALSQNTCPPYCEKAMPLTPESWH
jgi:alkanesulfonate monooxygenase SsuD/methylene tetrahydromethanopterin reductase-like flavin-dependent oxidoreductase (luciferase family)